MSAPLLAALLSLAITASWKVDKLDPSDLDATFATVFEQLPDKVTIFPSENYYYWQMKTASGKTIWGNLRLAVQDRDEGELSFAAGKKYKTLTADDGVRVERLGTLKYAVDFKARRVVFHLNPLLQQAPEKFVLGKDEHFVQRTYDESGLQFILLYNTSFKDFLWVLNEEKGVKNTEDFSTKDGVLVGKRSGFIFWQDGDRKVLAAVSASNVKANDYHDGPFDQLADNYGEKTPLKKFLVQREPHLADQIDEFGRYKNGTPERRIALTNYLKYKSIKEAIDFVKAAKQSGDPQRHISKGGR